MWTFKMNRRELTRLDVFGFIKLTSQDQGDGESKEIRIW